MRLVDGATSLPLSVDLEVDRPVNVLARPGLSVAEIVEAGAQRISLDGSLAWAAVEAMAGAAERIRDAGDLDGLGAPLE